MADIQEQVSLNRWVSQFDELCFFGDVCFLLTTRVKL